MLRWRFQSKEAFTIILVFALAISGLISSSVIAFSDLAEGDGDLVEVEVGVLPVLSVVAPDSASIVLKPGGLPTETVIPLKFYSNSNNGLFSTLSVNAVSTSDDDDYSASLVNTYDVSKYIPTLTETITKMEDFPFDRWGCTLEDDGGYHGVATADKAQPVFIDFKVTNGVARNLKCAARASGTMSSGIYNNVLVIKTVPNVVPDTIDSINYMQEINDTVIASMTTEQQYRLVDLRDKKMYWVSKMADGRVWMTQNLDYNAKKDTQNGYRTREDWGSLYPENTGSEADAYYDRLYSDGGYYYYDDDSGEYKDASTIAYNDERTHYLVGSFYNNFAGSRGLDGDNASSTETVESWLCPYGWTMPNSSYSKTVYGDIDLIENLYSIYGAGREMSDKFYLAPMGYISATGELTGVGQQSYYLTGTKTKTGRLPSYPLAYDAYRVLSVNDSYIGRYDDTFPDTAGGFIRCVSVPTHTYNVYYNEVFSGLDEGIEETYHSYDDSVSIPLRTLEPLYNDWEFIGWTTTSNNRVVAKYSSSVNLEYTSTITESYGGENQNGRGNSAYLYAAWAHNFDGEVVEVSDPSNYPGYGTLADITYMQEVTPEIVSNTNVGIAYRLIDQRDGKEYTVKKLADGNVWMMQNLDLDFDEDRILTPADSNVTTSRSISKTDPLVSQTSDSYGSSYNYYTGYAASVSGDLTPYSEIEESICPAGWTLSSNNDMSLVYWGDVPEGALYDGLSSGTWGGEQNNSSLVSTIYRNGVPMVNRYNQYDLYTIDNYASSSYNGFTRIRCVAARKIANNKTLSNITYMQEMRPDICAATEQGTIAQLIDSVDNQKYFVKKMSDGNCWMIQNYNISTGSGFIDGGKAVVYDGFIMTNDYANLPDNSLFYIYTTGKYYTYKKAVSNTDVNETGDAARSVCPRGWRLPTINDPVIPDENESHITLHYFGINNGSGNSSSARYWTSTKQNGNNCYAQHLDNGTDTYTCSSDTSYYYPIRCLAK